MQWGDIGTLAGASAAVSTIITGGGWKLIKSTIRTAISDYIDSAQIGKTLATHDTALALLIQQVMPPGEKSLRTILSEIQVESARAAGAASVGQTIVKAGP